MKAYSFSPYDPDTKRLYNGCLAAFRVNRIVINGQDRIRGSIVYEGKRYTLAQTATLKRLLPEPADTIECNVSFQIWDTEMVAVPKLTTDWRYLHSSKIERIFK